MIGGDPKGDLYRRLAQARRMIAQPLDQLTKERLGALVTDIETHLAAIEARKTDAPPE